MADSRTEQEMCTMSQRSLVVPESKEVFTKTKTKQKKLVDGSKSKEHRIQPKEFPVDKAEIFKQQNKVVLDIT